ncbi:MAG TPA: metalloregulator ArsR/SmtB family transcription factor [Candidatus Desulfaltia sp.]|nr:metalloregulator ArsR/SmtB family transcription factor [Candidatus Desulfaltia sp.]
MDKEHKMIHTISREAFKLLEDETRRRIVFMIRDSPLTVKEIAGHLSLTPQNIYHHMNKLQDAGVVELSYERRNGHIIESYYSVSADTFIYSDDRIDEKPVNRFMNILFGLREMGVPVQPGKDNASRLEELDSAYQGALMDPSNRYEVCETCSFSGFFMKFGPMNPLQLNRILWYANLIRMSDSEYREYLDRIGELRGFLRSIADQATR